MKKIEQFQITGMTISGFKNYQEPTELVFGNPTVITGGNGRGKTSIADAISFAVTGLPFFGERGLDRLHNEVNPLVSVRMRFLDENGMSHELTRTRRESRVSITYDGYELRQLDLSDMFGERDVFLSIFNPLYFIEELGDEGRNLLEHYLPKVSQPEVLAQLSPEVRTRLEKEEILSPEAYMKARREEIRNLEERIVYITGQRDQAAAQNRSNTEKHKTLPQRYDALKQELSALEARQFSGMDVSAMHDQLLEFSARYSEVRRDEQSEDAEVRGQLTALREKILSYDERILDAQASVSYRSCRKLFLSQHRDLDQTVTWTTGSVLALASRGQEIKMAYHPCSILGGAEVLEEMDAGVEKVARDALELLESQPIQPGEYECICDPDTTGMIVHEAFGHGVEMDMFVKDRALAQEFVGEYVASPLVTMHDGSAVEQTATAFFDDEGTLTGDTIVIDKGVLKTGMCDALSAARLGVAPTGNGRRESYERKAYTRMTNTYFQGGSATVEEMIASVEQGYLLEMPSSGMEDPKNWGIQCMVTTAREVRNGKLTGKLFSPIVLTGYVPDLLKSVTMMSRTPELSGSGMCGKGYKEWVKVSDGGPYMKARIRLG